MFEKEIKKIDSLNDFSETDGVQNLKKLNGMVWKFDISNLNKKEKSKIKDSKLLKKYFDSQKVRSIFGRRCSFYKYLSVFIHGEVLYIYLKFGFGMSIFDRKSYEKFWNEICSKLDVLDLEIPKFKPKNESYKIKIPNLDLVNFIKKADKSISYGSFEIMFNKVFSSKLKKMTEYYNYPTIGNLFIENREILRQDQNIFDLVVQKTLNNNNKISYETIVAWRFITIMKYGFTHFKNTYNVESSKSYLMLNLNYIFRKLNKNKSYNHKSFQKDFYKNKRFFNLVFKGFDKKSYSKIFKIETSQDFEVLRFAWKKDYLERGKQIKDKLENKTNIKVPYSILDTDNNTQKLFLLLLIKTKNNGLTQNNSLNLTYNEIQERLGVSRRTVQRKLKTLKKENIIDYTTIRPNSKKQTRLKIRWFDDLVS